MKLKVGRCYLTKNDDVVIITGYQPHKKFNKYIGYAVRKSDIEKTTYIRMSPIMSWGENGDYYWSGWDSKHDLLVIAQPSLQPLLQLDMIKII
jgi:hypothetical protein